MAWSLLVDRLARLEAAGVLEKRPYQDRPVRHGYHLTAMGKALYDAALMILRWETRWHYDETSPHIGSNTPPAASRWSPSWSAQACERPVEARDVELVPGPAGLEPRPGPASSAARPPRPPSR